MSDNLCDISYLCFKTPNDVRKSFFCELEVKTRIYRTIYYK